MGALWFALAGVAAAAAAVPAVLTYFHEAWPDLELLGGPMFGALTTYGGTLLAYGVLVPLAVGLAVALVPLQIGARGIAFAPLVSGAFWLGAFGVLAVIVSPFATGPAPQSGWVTAPEVALDPAITAESVRLVGLLLLSLSLVVTAVALLATLHSQRAPGMTWERMPFFAQAANAYAAALIPLAGVSALGSTLLLLGRENPGSFDWYVTEEGIVGGYEWVFQQGVVLISLVVALGAVIEIAGTFARRPLPGRRAVTHGLVAVAVLAAVVPSVGALGGHTWAQTLMLVVAAVAVAAGAPAAFAALSPTTLRGLKPGSPTGFAAGSLKLWLVAALVALLDLLGVAEAGAARAEAFLCAGLVGLLGALVYWWPKLFGRVIDGRPLVVVLASATAGSLALVGGKTFDVKVLAAVGTFALVAALLVFAATALQALVLGRRVGGDPWLGDTLEWYASSPAPAGNFSSLPPVESARPLADLRARLGERD